MSHIRHDPVTDAWVIIAEERGLRPHDLQPAPDPSISPALCPFCPGNEHLTPPEIRGWGRNGSSPNTPGWSVRVIPNRYAALRVEGKLECAEEGVYQSLSGIGAHEVIIDTPDHAKRLHDLDVSHLSTLMDAWHERMVDLARDTRFRYVQVFRNFGAKAGASLEHPHTQVIALPILPRWVREELQCADVHWRAKQTNLFHVIVEQEMQGRQRLVMADEHFAVFTPYASLFPFETWIVPRRTEADFRRTSEAERQALARTLGRTLRSLAVGLNMPPYNLVLHSAPFSLEHGETATGVQASYCWHIEIIPRLTIQGGFEWGTGFHINPTPPETAAAHLREALGESSEA